MALNSSVLDTLSVSCCRGARAVRALSVLLDASDTQPTLLTRVCVYVCVNGLWGWPPTARAGVVCLLGSARAFVARHSLSSVSASATVSGRRAG